jgi:regulator of cell morphogenesis and NO signaling
MILLENKTIAEIVTDNINTAVVFKKYKIDFGFKGNIILKKACEKNNINVNNVIAELLSVDKKKFYLKDYNSWDIDLLLQFLKEIQHDKKQDEISILTDLSLNLDKKYSKNHPYIKRLNECIQLIKIKLVKKIYIEENNIYPYVKNLLKFKKNSEHIKNVSLEKNIKKLEKYRLFISDKFNEIVVLTDNFKTSKNVDASFKLLFERLEHFLFDLQEHNHIEKNILFPKALELEASLID